METNYYNKLKDLLCECEAVKKDIMELRFGTPVSYGNTKGVKHFYIGDGDFGGKLLWIETTIEGYSSCSVELEEDEAFEIIGNNLEYHHLMMYCEINNINLLIDNGVIIINGKGWTELDNTKPFHLQDEEVFKNIYEYFKK